MITRFLSAAERVASPWKNGGGVTREIAAWPEGSGLEDFDWRISMAEVGEPGGFSLFAGIDRCLTVLRGTLSLNFGDRAVFLDGQSDPFEFAGDKACHGVPVGGPVLDLNVMCRRGRFSSRVERVSEATWSPSGDTAVLVALEPLAVGAESLNAFDALSFTEIDPAETPSLFVGGRAVAVALTRL